MAAPDASSAYQRSRNAGSRRIRVGGGSWESGAWEIKTRVFPRQGASEPGGGDACPLVLITGLGMSGADMVPLAKALCRRFPIHVPDNVGFGDSSKPGRALDIRQLGGALADWMTASALGDACVFANSMGCQIAVQLALTSDDLADFLRSHGERYRVGWLDPSAARRQQPAPEH